MSKPLLTPDEVKNLPSGTTLISICGNKAAVGKDEIDLDTRFGKTAWAIHAEPKSTVTTRFDYVQFDEQGVGQLMFYKDKYIELDNVVSSLEPGRSKSLAQTALEESFMWVGKALRDEQIQRNIAREN